jgi:hypothetical protein
MDRIKTLVVILAFSLMAAVAVAQDSSTAPASSGNAGAPTSKISTVRGCLQGQRGNYIVVENESGSVYVLKGVGNKLDRQLRHEVEVKGKILPGTIKTGVTSEKAGSNPSDTVHGVDGVPFQVADVQNDVRTISKQCKAADKQ